MQQFRKKWGLIVLGMAVVILGQIGNERRENIRNRMTRNGLISKHTETGLSYSAYLRYFYFYPAAVNRRMFPFLPPRKRAGALR